MPQNAEYPLPDPGRIARIEALEDRITELAAHIHAATYRLLELIREYDEQEGWVGPGLNSCAHWLNWKCGIALGAAREKVRVAHALKDLPAISAAFREGRISYSKVRAMTRVATPENEDYLLMIARHGTASHVERLVRNYRKCKRIEALELENRRHDLRRLSWYEDDDGSWVLRGRFTPEQGARIVQAIEAAAEEEYREQKDVSAETSYGPEIEPKSDPAEMRRADALVRVAEGFLSGAGNSTAGGDRSTIHLHTDHDTLRADGAGAEAELEAADRSGRVSAETSRRLACDAGVVHWLDGPDGEPLNISRKTRTIPPAIRRALKRRDGGCRFPGCTATRFVDAHHIRHWADGGETRMDNLVLLCRSHHRLVHEDRFNVEMQPGGEVAFRYPDGQSFPAAPKSRFRGNVFALMARNHAAGIRINPDTPVPDWDGGPMDDNMAVQWLLEREV